MNRRGIGILLGVSSLVALLALVQDYRFDQQVTAARAASLEMERELMAMETTVSSIRAAQAGYSAAGQVPASWMSRADSDLERLGTAIEARKAAASPDTLQRWELVERAFTALRNADGAARAWVDRGDRAQASQVIFVDGAGAADRLIAQLAAIRALDAEAAADSTASTGWMRIGLHAAILIGLLGVAAALGRALADATPKRTPSMAEMIRDLPPPVKKVAPQAAPPPPPPPAAIPTTSAAMLQRPVAWSATAELCVDLARLLDGRDVPALLERAATLLDAKGIMIWSVDANASRLQPSLCQGYGESVLRRLRPLEVEDDNITSLAFRTMQPQTMPGAALGESAAIAVPLITPTGCVGVLAAEVRQSRPHPDVVPLARILAAQFSTLVAPPDQALSKAADA